jgi:hypothetical protein
MIAGAHETGESVADIVDAYPTLSLDDAEAIVAFCVKHPGQVRAYLAEERHGRLMQAAIEKESPGGPLMERPRARWAERNAEVRR